MVDPTPLPKVDPAYLKQLNDEFVDEYVMGTIETLLAPPFDPDSDPFGRSYSWLRAPSHPYDAAYDELIGLSLDVWYVIGGGELRCAVLAGTDALGSDEDVFQNWAHQRFPAICVATGEDGASLLENLSMCQEIVYEVATLLESEPAFSKLIPAERVLAAMIAIKLLTTSPSK